MYRNTYDSDNTVFSPQGRLHQVCSPSTLSLSSGDASCPPPPLIDPGFGVRSSMLSKQ
jgi:hypothetical protein